MKNGVILLVILLLAVAGGLAAWRWGWLPFAETPLGTGNTVADAGSDEKADSAYSNDHNIHALGRLEPAGGLLTIGAIVGDHLEKLEVEEGAQVQEGDVIAILASHKMRQLEQKATQDQIQEAESRLKAEEAAADAKISIANLNVQKARSSQAEIAAQEKQVALAQSNLELTRKDLARMEGLSAALVSRQELERQRLLVTKSEAELAAASAALESLRETSQFALQGAQAELNAAEAAKQQVLNSIAVESLRTQAELAKTQAEQSIIKAPVDGTVLRIFTREGEIISNKPILQMADLRKMVCIAEVYEGDLPNIRLGAKADVASPAFPGDGSVRGVVRRIGGMIATPELRSLDPFAPTDRHVVEVEIHFPKDPIPDLARLVNLQVEVTILTPSEGPDENTSGVAKSRP